jgi:hypothetical protein
MICWVCGGEPSLIFERDMKDGSTFLATVCGGCLVPAYQKITEEE